MRRKEMVNVSMKKSSRRHTYPSRNRRKNRYNINKIIILIGIILISILTLLCIHLFRKSERLQTQVDNNKVHAAGSEDNSKDNPDKNINNNDINDDIDSNKGSGNNEKVEVPDKDSDNSKDIKDTENETIDRQTDEAEPEQTQATEDQKDENESQNHKKVYLTFDDGPSKNTPKVLDILDEYNIKATFFVIGKTDQHSLAMYKRIVDEGHTLGIHSYTHKYDEIYKSVDNFKKDFNRLRDLLFETTNYLPTLYRFPGGSGNQVSHVDVSLLIDFLNENSITYFDWNVANGDGVGGELTTEDAYNNVMEGVETFKTSVVLMHDSASKDITVEALPRIIESLIEMDAEILPLSEDVAPVQHVKAKP
jgi:peptidoglycan-N-acetylglucosamine deacetylase